MNDVLILGEISEGTLNMRTLELIGIGKRLAGDIGGGLSVVLVGDTVSAPAEEALSYGPDRVYALEHPLLAGFKPDLWVESLEQGANRSTRKSSLWAILSPVWSWARDWPFG